MQNKKDKNNEGITKRYLEQSNVKVFHFRKAFWIQPHIRNTDPDTGSLETKLLLYFKRQQKNSDFKQDPVQHETYTDQNIAKYRR